MTSAGAPRLSHGSRCEGRAGGHPVGDRSRRRHGLRTTTTLVLLAIVPLGVFATPVASDIRAARHQSESARSIEAATRHVLDVGELEVSLIDEQNWGAATQAVADFGTSLTAIKEIAGLDIAALQIETRARVDRLVADLNLADLAPMIEEARKPKPTVTAFIAGYAPIQRQAKKLWTTSFAALDDRAGALHGGAALYNTTQALEASADARESLMLQLWSFFQSQFNDEGDEAEDALDLIRLNNQLASAITRIEESGASIPAVMAQLRSIRQDKRLATLQTIVNAAISETVRSGAVTQARTGTVVTEVPTVVTVLQATGVARAKYVRLMDLVADEFTDQVRTLRTRADVSARRTVAMALFLLAVVAIVIGVASRTITRPLRSLAGGAKAMRSGDSSHRIAVVGPREVQEAATAMNEAAGHLELVERQARALVSGDLGAAAMETAAPGALGKSLQEAVQTLTASMVQREELRTRLAHEATHDGLTRMANRNATMNALAAAVARAARSGSQVALLFLDLDGFKGINDVHGHQTGDLVLIEVARRLGATVRQGDHIGRLGGDEFVVIAEPVGGAEEAILLSRRILDAIAIPIVIDRTGPAATYVTIGASIGIALASDESLTAEELLRDADMAVYKAKESGRGTFELCDERLRAERVEKSDLTKAVRRAIEHDEFTMYYQPIISHGTGDLHALEALVRWECPGQGLVFPDGFIPFAERSDLIIDVDRWVLHAVAKQLAAWTNDPLLGEIPVAINISGRHLASDVVVQNVAQALQTHGVDPGRVMIEVTESAVLNDLHDVAEKIKALRDIGIRVAVDDFGTGYTSVAHLRTLPIDILKIDRSFTASASHDLQSESIVKLIIDIGHLLGARITAEGVETQEQAAQLAGLGTDELQGYLYATPVPPENLKAMIGQHAAAVAAS